jgi:hypothetical protein
MSGHKMMGQVRNSMKQLVMENLDQKKTGKKLVTDSTP